MYWISEMLIDKYNQHKKMSWSYSPVSVALVPFQLSVRVFAAVNQRLVSFSFLRSLTASEPPHSQR